MKDTIIQKLRSYVLPLGLLATVLMSLMLVVNTLAWGPDRKTFTIQNPASYVTFNSITNNPKHGDERNFMQIREATAANSGYTDEITVTPGKEYVVYVYYHNNAASNHNASGKGIAKGAYAKAAIPGTLKNGVKTKATAKVGASNASPTEVHDDITLNNASGADIAMRYVPGSTTIHSFGRVNNTTMPDTIMQGGVSLGYDKLDGTLPGCNEYAGYITFRIKADQPNFTFSKQVRKSGDKNWSKQVTVKANETVEYRLEYVNKGTTEQTNVVVKDKLPAGINYINGSTKLYNGNNPQGKTVGDGINAGGLMVGNYAPQSNAIVVFSAKVETNKLVCGVNTLTNQAGVETKNGNKQDTAKVVVKRDCVKITVCELKTKKIISINENDFNKTKHSKDVKDCAEAKIKVCEISTKKIIEIKGKEFDGNIHSLNADDCNETPVTPVGELPHTGPTAMIAVMSVLVVAGMAAAYYLQHRQAQRNKMVEEFGAHIAAPKAKLLEAHLTKNVKK